MAGINSAGNLVANNVETRLGAVVRDGSDGNSNHQGIEKDPRVRISPKPGGMKEILGISNDSRLDQQNILGPLIETNGVMFPYTPTIQAAFSVEYGSYQPVHSNQDFQAYSRTPSATFNISGEFTAQNQAEGLYSLAVIHFFRTITKMYFGDNGAKNGVTPPTLLLNGYGNLMFNNLPIIVTQYSVEFVNNVDYVRVATGSLKALTEDERIFNASPDPKNFGVDKITPHTFEADAGVAWIPSKFLITVSCVVNHTPKQMREFNLDAFRTGKLLKDNSPSNKKQQNRGGWW